MNIEEALEKHLSNSVVKPKANIEDLKAEITEVALLLENTCFGGTSTDTQIALVTELVIERLLKLGKE